MSTTAGRPSAAPPTQPAPRCQAWSGNLSSAAIHYVLTDAPWTHAVAPVFFSRRRRQTSSLCDWSSDVCSSDLGQLCAGGGSAPPPPSPPPPSPPPDTTPPSAPGGLAAGLVIERTAAFGFTVWLECRRVLCRSIDSGQTKLATTTSTSATVTGLSPSTAYTFTVRAFDEIGRASCRERA